MRSILLVVLLFAGEFVLAQSAAELMHQVHAAYRARFDSTGKYINDPAARDRFIAQQNAVIQKLRATNRLQKSIRITNNMMSDLVVTVSIVQEPGPVFAGLLVERNKYDNKDEMAQLRLFNIPILLKGMDVLRYNGVSVINLKSQQVSADAGGLISIKYPTDYKKRTYGQADFNVLRTTTGVMSFFTPAKAGFSRAEIEIWLNIFSQNFGVESISFK
jgi:hypothetical protein